MEIISLKVFNPVCYPQIKSAWVVQKKSTSIRGRRWWCAIFTQLVDTSNVSACLLYWKINNQKGNLNLVILLYKHFGQCLAKLLLERGVRDSQKNVASIHPIVGPRGEFKPQRKLRGVLMQFVQAWWEESALGAAFVFLSTDLKNFTFLS